MPSIVGNVAITFVVLLAIGAPSEAQKARSDVPQAVVRITTDARGFLSYDRFTVVRLDPQRALTVRLPPGRYVFEATDDEGGRYWTRDVLVHASSLSIAVDFGAAAATRRADSQRLENLRQRRAASDYEVANLKRELDSTSARLAANRATVAEATAVAMRKIQDIIDAVGTLEQRLQMYTETAAKLESEAQGIRSDSASLGSSGVGAIAGLLGNISASKTENQSRQNKLRARGVLLRMNRLTVLLAEASDSNFSRLPGMSR